MWVTLAPSGGSPGTARPTKIMTFDVAVDVRLRLGFKPMDAALGKWQGAVNVAWRDAEAARPESAPGYFTRFDSANVLASGKGDLV